MTSNNENQTLKKTKEYSKKMVSVNHTWVDSICARELTNCLTKRNL